ncbi:MAG: dUTP diphosphatase [Planctomycetes bacterium]|jgi:dUTP pyrophosphatase|nr:dUTP diphosphatase [Planctomycetota bacterium]
MSHTEVRFKRLHAKAQLPAYQSAEAAGMDLHACLDAPLSLQPGDLVRVPLGWIMAIPSGFEGQVRPRSGLAAKHGITVPNAPGTIDSDYRGEAVVALINLGRETFVIEHGMRIAQLVVAPVARAGVREVDEIEETARGRGGFGSTGR